MCGFGCFGVLCFGFVYRFWTRTLRCWPRLSACPRSTFGPAMKYDTRLWRPYGPFFCAQSVLILTGATPFGSMASLSAELNSNSLVQDKPHKLFQDALPAFEVGLWPSEEPQPVHQLRTHSLCPSWTVGHHSSQTLVSVVILRHITIPVPRYNISHTSSTPRSHLAHLGDHPINLITLTTRK